MAKMTIKTSRRPNSKEQADIRKLMKREQLGQVTVRIESPGQDSEEMILTVETKDGTGRTLLVD